MRQFQFTYSTIEAAISGIGEIREKLVSTPHHDAAAIVFLIACDRGDAELLLQAWDQDLPEVKRVGITEGFEVGRTQRMQIMFNLLTADQGSFHVIQMRMRTIRCGSIKGCIGTDPVHVEWGQTSEDS